MKFSDPARNPDAMRAKVLIISALAVAAIAGSCAAPDSGKFHEVKAPDVFGLASTSTSTTTTTTTTTIATTTSAPPVTTATTLPPATTAVPVVDVPLFFISGTQLVPVNGPIAAPLLAARVLAKLQAGIPEGDAFAGLTTLMPNVTDFEIKAEIKRGIAEVSVPATFKDLPTSDAKLAFGQIVLSLQLPRIGGVRFLVDNLPIPAIIADGSATGDAVTVEDYQELIPPS